MNGHLWKVTAIKNIGRLTKGMEVEIIVKGRSSKPTVREIIEAFRLKYNVIIPDSHCGSGQLSFQKIS